MTDFHLAVIPKQGIYSPSSTILYNVHKDILDLDPFSHEPTQPNLIGSFDIGKEIFDGEHVTALITVHPDTDTNGASSELGTQTPRWADISFISVKKADDSENGLRREKCERTYGEYDPTMGTLKVYEYDYRGRQQVQEYLRSRHITKAEVLRASKELDDEWRRTRSDLNTAGLQALDLSSVMDCGPRALGMSFDIAMPPNLGSGRHQILLRLKTAGEAAADTATNASKAGSSSSMNASSGEESDIGHTITDADTEPPVRHV